MDRRRRVMREHAETAKSTRSRKTKKAAKIEEPSESTLARRELGYSQEVRRACQQRMVAIIPVRRLSLTIFLGVSATIFGSLLYAHYALHVAGSPQIQQMPIAYLFHIRSPHSIAQWMGSHLWLLTAIVGLLIFQIRKHRLDDYQASYRIWLGMICASLFASFDSSSSVLMLIGTNIDGWAQTQIGYSGWAITLSIFATGVGIIALKLCSEIKSSPAALIFWLGGLMAWGFSALYGTGLLKNQWSPAQLDMLVGGGWLGGIMSVFLASSIYLRQIYIQAQRRFVERGRLVSRPIRLPWRQDIETDENLNDIEEKRGWLNWRRRSNQSDDNDSVETKQTTRRNSRKQSGSSNQDEHQESRRSTVSDEAVNGRRSRNWWGWSRRKNLDEFDQFALERDGSSNEEQATEDSQSPRRWFRRRREDDDSHTQQRRTWFSRRKERDESDEDSSETLTRTERRQLAKMQRDEQRAQKRAEKQERIAQKKALREEKRQLASDDSDGEQTKRSWFSRRSNGVAPSISVKSDESDEPKKKRGIFGLFDSFKLQPPIDEDTPPAEPPATVTPQQTLPSTAETSEPSSQQNRRLSKSERKRQRRENRRAA